MKYLKVIFTVTGLDGDKIKDEMLLQASKDILCQQAGDVGFESFEEKTNTVTGYIQKSLFDKNSLMESLNGFPLPDISITYVMQDAEDKNWNKTWEDNGFEPINVNGKCVIHDTKHYPQNLNTVLDITIDAKQAFGTGNHETTYMIVNELLETEMKGEKVLDCGCGTGILSIISAKLGAESVTGYDIDEWSVENTKHNCKINNVANVNVIHGDASVITQTRTKFDIIVANINRNILLNDLPAFKSAMSVRSKLILSGFYTQDAEMLIGKADTLGLTNTKNSSTNGWCMLMFEKKTH